MIRPRTQEAESKMTSRKRPRGRLPVRLAAVLVTALTAVLLLGGTAGAAQAARYVDTAASALGSDFVYVSPDYKPQPSPADVDQLRGHISGTGDIPIYVAVLPDAALNEGGGTAAGVARGIASTLGRPGVYAVMVGDHFAAGSTRNALPTGEAPKLATDAFNAHKDDPNPRLATLVTFVDSVRAVERGDASGDTAAQGSGSGSRVGSVLGIAVAILVLVGAGALILRSRRRRRERERELAQVKKLAQEDLVALGEDIRALDIDTQMPGVNPEVTTHYTAAVESYQRAADALDRARRVEEMAAVSSALEAGRFSMASSKALLEGRALPERRPPCFFDPRHGPSVEDVTWAPPGGAPRDVPACATCANQVRNGIEPQSREVLVDDRPVPFWRAPAYYGPWYGGYFGGGAGSLLTGLLIGSMLGGFGGWGWGGVPVGADAGGYGDGGGDAGNGGDWGGGGDFGGGGDWGGGGDFGGGDFGGGGDF
jgi:hypothetical protein